MRRKPQLTVEQEKSLQAAAAQIKQAIDYVVTNKSEYQVAEIQDFIQNGISVEQQFTRLQRSFLSAVNTQLKSSLNLQTTDPFPGISGISSAALESWGQSNPAFYTRATEGGYEHQQVERLDLLGTEYKKVWVPGDPATKKPGWNAFGQAILIPAHKNEAALTSDLSSITAKLATGKYSELVGVADIALKTACGANSDKHVDGLLKAGADPSRTAIAEISKNELLSKETVKTLILGGVDSKIILENLNPKNPDRDVIVALIAKDQAVLKVFESARETIINMKSTLGLTNLTNNEIVDLAHSVMLTQGVTKDVMEAQGGDSLNKFNDALYLTYFQEFVADVIGIFSDKGRDAYRAGIITEQLKEVFDNTIKPELKELQQNNTIKGGGFVAKLQAERDGQNQGQSK
jgi:hypothetical protein